MSRNTLNKISYFIKDPASLPILIVSEQSLMMNEVHPVHGNLYIIDSVLLATSEERERGRRRTQRANNAVY